MLILLVILVFWLAFLLLGSVDPPKTPCYKLKFPHEWVYKGEKGSEYMVCNKCGMMPGGAFEESE